MELELLPSGEDGTDLSEIPIVDSLVPSAETDYYSVPSDGAEEATVPMSISVVEGPSALVVEEASTTGAKEFRYPNSGGNFYTGIDITSEVGGA